MPMSSVTYALAAKIVIATQTTPDTANQATYPQEVFMRQGCQRLHPDALVRAPEQAVGCALLG
ncbi:hypothetical protein GCM10022267_59330 [Lentzea roselyniae]|uniref:Uncharacterized protein n=1 Tax=Lentzea roselyniae TaxID=531940 RepID=A0ABP7BMK1_9PSEU